MSDLRVTKHNDLITSRVNFSLMEYRVFLYGIALMNPTDTDFPLSYEINIHKFADMFGCDLNSLYTELKSEILTKMKRRGMTIDQGQGWKRNFNLIRYVDYHDSGGIIRVHFDEEIKPFVQELTKHFTSYYIEQIALFKSSYSIRFYEWCVMMLKQNGGKPTQFFLSVKDIKERLELEKKYDRYNNLKQRVITKAINEINTHSDINVRFEEIKRGRSVDQLKLIVKYKKWAKKEKQYTLNFDPKLKVDD